MKQENGKLVKSGVVSSRCGAASTRFASGSGKFGVAVYHTWAEVGQVCAGVDKSYSGAGQFQARLGVF